MEFHWSKLVCNKWAFCAKTWQPHIYTAAGAWDKMSAEKMSGDELNATEQVLMEKWTNHGQRKIAGGGNASGQIANKDSMASN